MKELNHKQARAVNIYISEGLKSKRGAMLKAGYAKNYANQANLLFKRSDVVELIDAHLLRAAEQTQGKLVDVIRELSAISLVDAPSLFVRDEDWEGHYRCKNPHELTECEKKSIKKITSKKIDIFEQERNPETGKYEKKLIKTVQRFDYEMYDKFIAMDMIAKTQGLFIKAQDPLSSDSDIGIERGKLSSVPTLQLKKQLDAINSMITKSIEKKRDDNAVDAEYTEVPSRNN